MKPTYGKFVLGICKGVSQRQHTNRKTGEIMTFTEIGIAEMKTDEYGDEAEIVTKIQLSKAQVSGGVPASIAQLKGKHVALSIWETSYATSKGDSNINVFLTNDWQQKLHVFA